jgi:hypothetical protein
MRMMMRVQMDTEMASKGIQDGSMPAGLEKLMDALHPEAAYFSLLNGNRTAFIVFDMTDSWQLPPALEPLFRDLKAKIDVSPAMNVDDLKKGLSALGS